MKKKIAVITPEFSVSQKNNGGGLATFLDKLILLINNEYEIHVICSSDKNQLKKYPKFYLHNVKVKYLILKILKYTNIPLINYIIYYPIQSFLLNNYLKKTKINFDSYFFTNFEYVSLFQDKKNKSIIRLSSLDYLWLDLNFLEKKISQYYDKLIFKKSLQIWSNSIFLAKKITKFKNKIKIIPTFINYKISNKNNNFKKSFILFVGTINERKGIALVSKLFEKLASISKLSFVIIGPDTKKNFQSQFNNFFIDKNFSNRLTYYGARDRLFISKFIKSSKIVVIPSKIENAPNILQEVLINDGVPLCSDNSSMEELLFNDKNFLFKNGNFNSFFFKAKKLLNLKKKQINSLKKYKKKLLDKNKEKKLKYLLFNYKTKKGC